MTFVATLHSYKHFSSFLVQSFLVGCEQLYKAFSKSVSWTLGHLAIDSWEVLVTKEWYGGITWLLSSLWPFHCRSHPLPMPTAILSNLVQMKMFHEELVFNKTLNKQKSMIRGWSFFFFFKHILRIWHFPELKTLFTQSPLSHVLWLILGCFLPRRSPHCCPKSCWILLDRADRESYRAAMKMLFANIEWTADRDQAVTTSSVWTWCQKKVYPKCPRMSYLGPSDKVINSFNSKAEGGEAVCVQRVPFNWKGKFPILSGIRLRNLHIPRLRSALPPCTLLCYWCYKQGLEFHFAGAQAWRAFCGNTRHKR